MIEIERLYDISTILDWRREVIENVFGLVPSDELMETNRRYYETHTSDDTCLSFIALAKGNAAGCGALCLTEELPSPDNASGRCGYFMNIYVRKSYREQGVAHAIVKKLIEEARKRNCGKIYLETTDDGRPVYASLGFVDLPDMMKLKG